MQQAFWEPVQALLGLGKDIGDVNALEMGLRTLVIYTFTLVIVRLGSKRFLSEATPLDYIVAITLGSTMSRAINGAAPFVPTLVAGAVLLGVHWLLAVLAFHKDRFSSIVKGRAVLLIKDGKLQPEGMRKASVSADDLVESLRLQSKEADPGSIRVAYVERNGKISALPFPGVPRVVNVSVESGVQTVRIEL